GPAAPGCTVHSGRRILPGSGQPESNVMAATAVSLWRMTAEKPPAESCVGAEVSKLASRLGICQSDWPPSADASLSTQIGPMVQAGAISPGTRTATAVSISL